MKRRFKLKSRDNVIFSSSVIPTPININARDQMDKKLRKKGVIIQADVHVSGHGSREDLRGLIEMLKPKTSYSSTWNNATGNSINRTCLGNGL